MAITLTEHAAKKIREKLVNSGKQSSGLGLGVKKVGCSGYAYTFAYANEVSADDHVFASHQVLLLVDAASLAFIDGSEVDFVKAGLKETLKFNNPNAASQCGCGESFNLKNPETLP